MSLFHIDKLTLKHGFRYIINLVFMSSAVLFLYKTFVDALPYYSRGCQIDPANNCDIGDFSSALYVMLKDKFTESFYDGMFQATFTYSFVGAFNAVEAHIRHVFRDYDGTNVIGWNIFVHDKKTGKIRLEIPSEDTCSMKELMQDDQVLLDKVSAAMNGKAGSDYPDFFIKLNSENDQIEFMRRIVNRVSQSIKSSQWPNYAMSRLSCDADREEDPLVIAVSEKDVGMRSYMMRTWLVFPSVLRELLKYSEDELNDPNGPFWVAREHHRIRLINLRRWAVAEFEEKGLDRAFLSTPIFLPRVPLQGHANYQDIPEETIASTPTRRSARLSRRR